MSRRSVAKLASVVFVLLVGLVFWLPGQKATQAGVPLGPHFQGKVEQKVLDDTSGGKVTRFVVLLSEQADLSAAYAMKDQDARGWYVYNTLTSLAARSQAGL